MSSVPINAFRIDARSSDSQSVRDMVRATGFFSEEEIAIAVELIDDRVANGDGSHYHFLFADDEFGKPVGYSCYGRIAGTAHSFDLYWIVVHPSQQRGGIGGALLAETETRIAAQAGGTARIYVETSSREQYQPTRKFYLGNGYRIEAELPRFYSPDDGKIILVKEC